jgi:predicted  nucleic acid-binding Zn-ribbon protein
MRKMTDDDKGANTGTGTVDVDALKAEVEKWKALSRQNEEKAKANADAAQRLAELKPDELTAKVAEAEQKLSAVPATVAESVRDILVDLGTVSEADTVLLTATDPETLKAQVKRLVEHASRQGNRAPLAGHTSGATDEDPKRVLARQLFNRGETN